MAIRAASDCHDDLADCLGELFRGRAADSIEYDACPLAVGDPEDFFHQILLA